MEIKLAILASGGGTTAEALIKSRVVDVAVVITNNSDAGVIRKAQNLGVSVEVMSRAPYKVMRGEEEDVEASRLNYGKALLEQLEKYGVTHISQNGWMILTPVNVVQAYEGRIVNQHPGPLDPGHPDFGGQGMYGLRVHGAVINFVKGISHPFQTEATIHQVNEEYDKGKLLMTRGVEILASDDAETLQKKVLPVEHRLQIDFWTKMANGGVEPYVRTGRLILPEEVSILEEAKKLAIDQFPKG